MKLRLQNDPDLPEIFKTLVRLSLIVGGMICVSLHLHHHGLKIDQIGFVGLYLTVLSAALQ